MDFAALKKELTDLERDTASFRGKWEIADKGVKLKDDQVVSLKEIEDFLARVSGAALPDLPMQEAELADFEVFPFHAKTELPPRGKMAINFGKTATWNVAEGVAFGLKSMNVEYWGGNWSGSVTGTIVVSDITFQVSLDWPSMRIDGHLMGNVDIAEFARRHHLPMREGQTPVLENLRIYAAPRAHRYHINLGAKNLIQLGLVSVDEADLRLDYMGGPDAAFTGRFHSQVTLGTLEFELTAEKTTKSWKAEAEARSNEKLGVVVAGISKSLTGTAHELSDFGVPVELANKTLSGLVSLSVDAEERHVTLLSRVSVSDGKGSARFEIDITKEKLTVRANLKIGDLDFEVDFSRQNDRILMAAIFTSEKGLKVGLKDLADLAVLFDGLEAPKIGASMEITLKDVMLAVATGDGRESRLLVAADVDGSVNLSGLGDLPVVGDLLPNDSSMKLSLAPILSSKSRPFDKEDIKGLNKLRGNNGPELPEEVQGPSLGVSLQLPGVREPLGMNLEIGKVDDDTAKDVEIKPTPGAPDKGAVKWVPVHKKLGPVAIERVGLALDKSNPADPKVTVLLDSALGFGGLNLSLIGLGGHYGIKSHDVGFEMHGMGLDFERAPLSLGGAFAEIDGDYVGKAHLSLKTIGVAASGGFKMIDGSPSMFIYGVLNTPLGGPPFFFVQGLAAGFGLNRNLTSPSIEKVHEFPFVKDATSLSVGKAPKHTGDDVAGSLHALHEYIRPDLGQYFMAAGIKFTSFKLLDSFVLMMLGFGRELKIDIIGMSTFQNPPIVPKGVPALARIELELDVAIRPAKGFVLVQARLGDNSYVYSSLVKLQGGFAFKSWFAGEHAGDFVISAGGYHPHYKKPAHYPDVERIGLTFKVPGFDVWIKGRAYFALTPSMMMAGGSLEASAHFGSVSASFKMNVDFMVVWEPSHYDASIRIAIDAEWSIFSTTATAELHVWGPKFAGYARVHWSAISFDVKFGHSRSGAAPISWTAFQQSFLPHLSKSEAKRIPGAKVGDAKVNPTMSVTAGGAGTVGTGSSAVHVVNPKELRVAVDCVLPFHKADGKIVTHGGKKIALPGCPPLDVAKIESAEITVSIDNDTSAFEKTVSTKLFPAAMWGADLLEGSAAARKAISATFLAVPAGKPKLNAKATVAAGGGIELKLRTPVDPNNPVSVDRTAVQFHEHDMTKVAAVKVSAITETASMTTARAKLTQAKNDLDRAPTDARLQKAARKAQQDLDALVGGTLDGEGPVVAGRKTPEQIRAGLMNDLGLPDAVISGPNFVPEMRGTPIIVTAGGR